jgi:hypothetical protein
MPSLPSLTRRLAETPPEFLLEPEIGRDGTVRVSAVVSDLMRALGGVPLTPRQAAAFRARPGPDDRNRLRLTLLVCWLLHDGQFRAAGLAGPALGLLTSGLRELAVVVPAEKCVSDADRREELVRVCLDQLGLRPEGEDEATARDRLATLSSVERRRVIAAARAAEQRVREVREAMARQAAYDAQMKAMRE